MPAAWIHAAVLRRGLLGLAAVLVAVVAIAIATTEPAGGEAPLECDGGLYVTTGSPDDMTLTRVDQETGALTAVGDGGLVANALGHNPQDDFLYGIDRNAPHHVVRVSAGGDEFDLGPAVGAPASWVLTFVGTFLANGHYLVLGDNAPARTSRGTVPGTWAEIDVTGVHPEVIRTFSHPSIGNNDLQDIALNPVDGELYGHSITRHRIVRINPTTGAATGIGPTFARPANAGSSFFDSFGRMWLYGSGKTVGAQDTLYRIDHVGRDTAGGRRPRPRRHQLRRRLLPVHHRHGEDGRPARRLRGHHGHLPLRDHQRGHPRRPRGGCRDRLGRLRGPAARRRSHLRGRLTGQPPRRQRGGLRRHRPTPDR